MPTEESIIERDDPMYRLSGNISFVLVILLMIACEVETIPGLWFKGAPHDYAWYRYALPAFIAVPALFLLLFRRQVKKWVATGKITSGLAERVLNIFGVALWITYYCVLELAELAFRTR
jgi:surface polysaccharide O-acyltransferase-like enzyme